MKCKICSSEEIRTEQVAGRGNQPKGWTRKPGDRRLISWKGVWNVYTCKCGHEWKKLIE